MLTSCQLATTTTLLKTRALACTNHYQEGREKNRHDGTTLPKIKGPLIIDGSVSLINNDQRRN